MLSSQVMRSAISGKSWVFLAIAVLFAVAVTVLLLAHASAPAAHYSAPQAGLIWDGQATGSLA